MDVGCNEERLDLNQIDGKGNIRMCISISPKTTNRSFILSFPVGAVVAQIKPLKNQHFDQLKMNTKFMYLWNHIKWPKMLLYVFSPKFNKKNKLKRTFTQLALGEEKGVDHLQNIWHIKEIAQ